MSLSSHSYTNLSSSTINQTTNQPSIHPSIYPSIHPSIQPERRLVIGETPREILDQSNFPQWISTPFLLYYRSKCTGTTAHVGQAAPASRCEPTFRSSETPALLVPKQRPCGVSGRLRPWSGTALKMSKSPIFNQVTHRPICNQAFCDRTRIKFNQLPKGLFLVSWLMKSL
jgi:hypothetical protein